MRRAAFLVLLSIAALPGSVGAGSYTPPPGDCCPQWSPDGKRIAFVTARDGGHALAVVNADGSGEQRLLERAFVSWSISPDWSWVATADAALHLSRLDGSGEHVLTAPAYAGRLSWSPDSTRLAFSAGGAVYTVRADAGGLQKLTAGSDPDWSPDGSAIAFQVGSPPDQNIHVVTPEGGSERLLVGGPGAQLEPIWSPDGSRIAFLTQPTPGKPFALGIVHADGSGLRTYTGPGVSNSGAFAWTADGRDMLVATNTGLVRVSLTTGHTTRLTRFGFGPAPSADGHRIAFAGGGTCQDRSGIYVMSSDGNSARRITNDCRIVGTGGNDTLHGTELADVLVGLGGNDRLFALDGGYVGDTLLGGAGDDVLIGAYRRDTLDGGSGNDVLDGGPSGDNLIGGPGRDHLNGQGGADLIRADDGERDRVTCGSNAGGKAGHDIAYVDHLDVVAADCEIVHAAANRDRSGAAKKASLTITVWPDEQRPGTSRTWTLRCDPTGGTLPGARTACSRLARLGSDAFAPTPLSSACTQIYGGPQLAFVRGSLGTRRVSTKLRRRDGCEIARWNRVAFLLPTP